MGVFTSRCAVIHHQADRTKSIILLPTLDKCDCPLGIEQGFWHRFPRVYVLFHEHLCALTMLCDISSFRYSVSGVGLWPWIKIMINMKNRSRRNGLKFNRWRPLKPNNWIWLNMELGVYRCRWPVGRGGIKLEIIYSKLPMQWRIQGAAFRRFFSCQFENSTEVGVRGWGQPLH